MKKRVKAAWIKALLSGKYAQGTSFLNRDGKFCCLGVLYDTLPGHRWSKEKDSTACSAGKGYVGLLSPEARAKCGLSHEAQSTLAGLNDSGQSFATIAKFIEKNL